MPTGYTYGSPEYQIEQIKELADKAIEAVRSIRYETSTIQSVKLIKLTGNFRSDIGYYHPASRNSYSYFSFDENIKSDVEKAAEGALKWVDEIEQEIEKIHEENIPKIESNKKLSVSIENFMKVVGIPKSYTTYDYPTKRHRNKQRVEHSAGYMKDIMRCIPTADYYESEIRGCKDIRRRIGEWRANKLRKISEVEEKKRVEETKLRKLAKAVAWAEENNVEYSSNDELFGLIDEKARQLWIDENYPDGTEVDIKCCDGCNTWVIGEHRCSCGNRRMELTVEGNFFDGFDAYPEPY